MFPIMLLPYFSLLLQAASELPEELLFGIPIPAIVMLVIELLKRAEIIRNGDQARLANIALSALLSVAVVYSAKIDGETARLVTMLVTALWGVLVSALGYNRLIAAPRHAAEEAELDAMLAMYDQLDDDDDEFEEADEA